MKQALAVDIGGSHATCAVVDGTGVARSATIPADGANGLRPLLNPIAETLRALMSDAGVQPGDCAGLAISVPGLVDSKLCRLMSCNGKFTDGPELDLPAWCHSALGVPLRMDNDARMALLGEKYAGAARGFDDVVMVTLGTGVGGAAMIGGKLLRGKHYQAGCLGGHLPVRLDGRVCTCGAIGCVETEASTWFLPEICRDNPRFHRSTLATESRLNFEILFRHADLGDEVAQEVRDYCAKVWAVGAVALIHAYDPEVVVFGGSVMKRGAVLLPYIKEFIWRHAWTPWGKVELRVAALGNEAALLGAIPLLSEEVA